MKYFLPVIIFLIISCNQKHAAKLSIPITLLLIPEDYDSSYSITWSDTLGQSKNYTTLNRPVEFWCDIMVGEDTVGYYHGLSMPRHFTYFHTSDSIIEVNFKIMPNMFSENMTEEIFDAYKKGITFQPIQINIKKDLRKEMKFVLTEK